MRNKLTVIFSIALAALLAVAMQPDSIDSTPALADKATDAYGCFRQGELWKDLGTNQSIYAAYDEQWCRYRVMMWSVGSTDNLCVRYSPIHHAFKVKWVITKVPHGQTKGYVSHDVCICFLEQVLNLCAKGGTLDLMCGPGTDGGDVIGAVVTADPQSAVNCYG
ncbi:hypothetical protein KVR01_004531 [Diaporthe batatas]|uniref:uncharacterized protein n=1 Tax=Diaporthe batatas TaxID=748121 RepID=UPI001D05C059|nr:uncharacterized protein KVR01_004531 [Diaporthe batatas]KAG8165979.1 hypothetical protein KVR01_004531 [Diaporthe batatas]